MEKLKKNRGQIVIEYVLLMSVAVIIAGVLTTWVVKRDLNNPNNQGFFIKIWTGILQKVGADVVED